MFRILIAEDDPSTARLLCAIVKRAGYEPLIAADGVQALELLDHNQIDLLLCDVMMPRMDGFALTKAIRESGSMLPLSRIAFVSAKPSIRGIITSQSSRSIWLWSSSSSACTPSAAISGS